MNPSRPTGTTMLPISRVKPAYNPRRYFDRKKHDDLVASFRIRGMLQPILVRPAPDAGDGYVIVAGGRRYRAALEVFGPEGEIPVFIREMTDQEALEAAIDENDNRDDASETEQADAAVRVLAACHGDRAEAVRRLGWSRSKFDRRLALAELSEPVKLALDKRRIKVGHAELLAAIPKDKQDKSLETILSAGLDVNKTRDLLMRVVQNLASACFDKSECTTCPFNSTAQRTLFETHVDDGHCTNPTCFGLKTEAAEIIRFEAEECAAKAARGAAPSATDDDEGDEQDDVTGETSGSEEPRKQSENEASPPGTDGMFALAPSNPIRSTNSVSAAQKSAVTAKSIANRTAELRQASWRTALARALASNAAHAHSAILVAAMSGTLSQIKADTLTARAGLLVAPSFPQLDYSAKIAEIRALPDTKTANVLSAIGAAYAKDVLDFTHVADLARTFGVDLRDSWHVDQSFLERYTKDELKFIAHECGLVQHLGQRAFAKLLGDKKPDLVKGMLNRIGFSWAGRLPSCMTLDGQYGPPPTSIARQPEAGIPAIAA